jgi:hypothetical protein
MKLNPSTDSVRHEGDDLLFGNEFIEFKIFSRVKFISSTEVLSYWAVETLGDFQYTSRPRV